MDQEAARIGIRYEHQLQQCMGEMDPSGAGPRD